ncbi:hypothetical protein ACFPVS_09020 [Neisseria weixii]|uniref:hypothetical protein n=1 Tax=Neisseria weixii TaxID=1853276 RepID=UPI00362149A1
MSTSEFWIDRENGRTNEVVMTKRACADLFAYMVPRMYGIAPEYAEEFEYGNWEVFSIGGAPEKYYRAICGLVLGGADELPSVAPYKADLKAVLEADPRFKAA